ncbi:MAG: hypothetical protein JSU73_05145 [candidate division WOR-3 bacterium]|nr:MAG: hypothetical protein JSU73_05145 [candidate division WOR-3 bacterium]
MRVARLFLLCALSVCLVTEAAASVTLVEDRLDLDALLWANVSWMMSSKSGFGSPGFKFYRRGAFVGLTGKVTSYASMRLYIDAGSLWQNPALDVYADFAWQNGIGLRAGQFKCPLGFEAMTEDRDLRMIEYSVVKRYWKPADQRDVGVLLTYTRSGVDAAVAVVNGNGRGAGFKDENNSKDASVRFALAPWREGGPEFAVRGYVGRWKAASLPYYSGAVEFRLLRGPLQIVTEAQYAKVQFNENAALLGRTSFYVQASYDFGLLEPVGRVQMEDESDDKYELGLTGGVTVRLVGDWLKLAVQYDYFRKEAVVYPQLAGTEQGLLWQLQAAI